MGAFKELRRLICQFDLFCSSELLRYHSETQYKTITGGLLSLVIVSVVVGGFASMVGDTLNRVAITSSLIVNKQSDPPLAVLKPGSENMFMLAIVIKSIDLTFQADLTNGPQYFSVSMAAVTINAGIPSVQMVSLEQCTREHWSMMPEFAAGYDSYRMQDWLCLPLRSSLNIQGTFTSPINQEIIIQVFPCQNTTYKNNCAPQQDIDGIFNLHSNFYLDLTYINPVINPNQQDFISYYIQGNDYVIFSNKVGSEAWIHFTDFTINSDNSILPYESTSTTTGCIAEQNTVNHPYTVTQSSPYVQLFLAKSGNSLTYNRQVQKISAVFSYIGGLVGAITALLFLIKSYTDTSLEVSIGLSLFELSEQQKRRDKNNENQTDKDFNMLAFIRLTFYRFLKFCGWKGKFERAQRLQKCQQEAIKQMDVEFLLKRVIKLETCMSKLFTPQQLKEIKQGQTITFKTARNMRMLLLKQGSEGYSEGHLQGQKSSKNQNIQNAVEIVETINHPQSQGDQYEQELTGTIFRVKKCQLADPLKQVSNPNLGIQSLKTFTRKAIIKDKKWNQNQKRVECKQDQTFSSNNPIKTLPPIII